MPGSDEPTYDAAEQSYLNVFAILHPQDVPPRSRIKTLVVDGVKRTIEQTVRFDMDSNVVHDVVPYAQQYDLHPREFVFTGPCTLVGMPSYRLVSPTACPYTGKILAIVQRRQSLLQPDLSRRNLVFEDALFNGSAWEPRTATLPDSLP